MMEFIFILSGKRHMQKQMNFCGKQMMDFLCPKENLKQKLIKKGYLIPAKDGRHKVKKNY